MEYYIDPVTFVTQKSGFESRYIKNFVFKMLVLKCWNNKKQIFPSFFGHIGH